VLWKCTKLTSNFLIFKFELIGNSQSKILSRQLKPQRSAAGSDHQQGNENTAQKRWGVFEKYCSLASFPISPGWT